jgi:hypothetical protein
MEPETPAVELSELLLSELVLFDEESSELVLFEEDESDVEFEELATAVALLEAALLPEAALLLDTAPEDLEDPLLLALPLLRLATLLAPALTGKWAGAAATEVMAIKAKSAAVNFIV